MRSPLWPLHGRVGFASASLHLFNALRCARTFYSTRHAGIRRLDARWFWTRKEEAETTFKLGTEDVGGMMSLVR